MNRIDIWKICQNLQTFLSVHEKYALNKNVCEELLLILKLKSLRKDLLLRLKLRNKLLTVLREDLRKPKIKKPIYNL